MKNLLRLLLLFSLNTFAQTGWQTLKEKDYSIKYPADWTADKTGQMGASFFLFSPLDSKSDAFRENINLIVQDLPA